MALCRRRSAWVFRTLLWLVALLALYFLMIHFSVTLITDGGHHLEQRHHTACGNRGRATCFLDDVTDQFTQDFEDYFRVVSPPDCHPEMKLIYVTEGNIVNVNVTALNASSLTSGTIYCYHREIKRDPQSEFDYLKGDRVYFTGKFDAHTEFERVRCRSGQEIIAEDSLAFVHLKTDVEKRCEDQDIKRKKKAISDVPSVVMLGLDSISRASFKRRMPKTRHYLTHTLGGIELTGYNKVDDNTLVNLVPLLSGQFLQQNPQYVSRKSEFDPYHFDDIPFIWNNFSRAGYRTMYCEDRQEMGVFHFLEKRGFKSQPTDYYTRPYFLGSHDQSGIFTPKSLCLAHRYEPDVLLDYLVSYTGSFLDKLHFSLTYGGPSHSSIHAPTWLDDINLRAIKQLAKQGSLNNSIFIMFSDHGIRYGPSRLNIGAAIEERLPFVVIVTPKWFRVKYPDLQHSLEENAFHLTTPFDIHATLMDVISMAEGDDRTLYTDRGQSLFHPVPLDRTCSDASVGLHWCACHDWTKLPEDSSTSKEAAQAAVDDLNNIMKTGNYSPPCLQLSLAKVHSAVAWKDDTPVLFEQDNFEASPRSKDKLKRQQICSLSVMVTIETTPGNEIFEITMCMTSEGIYKNWGYVSRLTKLKHFPICMGKKIYNLLCQCP